MGPQPIKLSVGVAAAVSSAAPGIGDELAAAFTHSLRANGLPYFFAAREAAEHHVIHGNVLIACVEF
jgi:hypothetical protein